MKRISMAGTAMIFVLASAPALAQSAASKDWRDGDIVVTATRQETLLSKTPIAMSAVGGDQLVQANISNPTQLEELVPNLSITRGNGLQITIRGVTSADGSEKGDPSAAFLLNGIYIARPQAQEVSFFDIERVEVLRGPQGTLYGRNTTAGVVNVISRRPQFEFGASADVSYHSYDNINAAAALNVPLAENAALRAAVNYDRRDNYVRNGTNDGFSYDPFKENLSFRLSGRWEPIDNVKVNVVGDYSKIKGTAVNTVPVANFFSNVAPGQRPIYHDSDSKDQRTNFFPQRWKPFRDNEEYGVMGEMNWDIGPAALTYLGSYRESQRTEQGTLFGSRNDFDGSYWQTSHEIRLAFGGSGPLQVQVGGYYFKEKSRIFAFFYDLGNLGQFPPFATRFGFPQDPTIAENKSAFGQATYEIMTDLRLTAGVRYSHDFKSRKGGNAIDTIPGIIPGNRIFLSRNDAARTFKKVTWRAGIDYDSSVGLFYASVATGYKAGGFNDGCEATPGGNPACVKTADQLYYNPEKLTAYEAGFKLKFADGAVRFNGSIFHYDYSDLQLTQIAFDCGGAACQRTTNAAKAKIDGVELDASLRPTDNLVFDVNANWLDARYDKYAPAPGINFAGRPLARSPKWTVGAGVTYNYPIGDGGNIVANARTRLSSKYDLTDTTVFIYFYQPSFTKTDLSLTYKAPNDRFYIGAFVENLENDIVLTSTSFGLAGVDGITSFADPRTFGVRGGVRF